MSADRTFGGGHVRQSFEYWSDEVNMIMVRIWSKYESFRALCGRALNYPIPYQIHPLPKSLYKSDLAPL